MNRSNHRPAAETKAHRSASAITHDRGCMRQGWSPGTQSRGVTAVSATIQSGPVKSSHCQSQLTHLQDPFQNAYHPVHRASPTETLQTSNLSVPDWNKSARSIAKRCVIAAWQVGAPLSQLRTNKSNKAKAICSAAHPNSDYRR